MTNRDVTVAELIDLWQEGELSIAEGDVEEIDHTTLQVEFKGTDGRVCLTYTLAEELTHRTDAGKSQFNILEDQ
jgi:hypothetical protein